ncbi:MAG: S9 family peptidase [Fidelibacterota bacterium]|nr:MAG: S9 family peptidase [Candidatus Neomarinimicrobiota bacterium]
MFSGSSAVGARAKAAKWTYPDARKSDVVEDFHGTQVPDPYHWMIDPDSPETQAWVSAQNQLTRSYLDAIPARDTIKARLTELWNYPRYAVPERHGQYYFYSKNDGLQDQSVLYMVSELDGEPAVVIDPNTLSEDGTVALMSQEFSPDGQLLAYTISRHGSDTREILIRDLASDQDFNEVLHWSRYTSIAWKPDGSGFYYNRFPEPGTAPTGEQNSYGWVYWHSLDTPQEQDTLVFSLPEHKDRDAYPWITKDGQYLLIWVYRGTDSRNGLYYRELDSRDEFTRLFDVREALYDVISSNGSTFYVHTDFGAPRGRLMALDAADQDQHNWTELIPQQEDVISDIHLVNDHFVLQVMHNAHELLRIYDLEGHFVREIELPAMGEIEDLSGRPQDTEFFFSFTSFLYPASIYRYDFETDEVTLFHGPEIDFDPSGYETRQVFYPSKDGTRVSLFLTHRKGLQLDGAHPTLLYGYGGFNISYLPHFAAHRLVFLEAGGVFAMANLRGGSEYGEEWHRAGMLENKQNVFDDFIAAGEWLIANGYTSQDRLAITGRSNGGLLTAVCLLQQPDLYGAVISRVPVTDMLHYHQWTAGAYWTGEFGNAEENPDHFRFMFAYSPLHNVDPGVAYPPLLVTTADTDDRVVPAHAKKFVATLQEKASPANPSLLRVETKAGHGGSSGSTPVSKLIEEFADIYAFLFHNLDMAVE